MTRFDLSSSSSSKSWPGGKCTRISPVATSTRPLATGHQATGHQHQATGHQHQTLVTRTRPLVTSTKSLVTSTRPLATSTRPLVTNTRPLATNTRLYTGHQHQASQKSQHRCVVMISGKCVAASKLNSPQSLQGLSVCPILQHIFGERT